MNREIKFRAWDKKQNKMREDIQIFYGSFWDILKDKSWVVMQFTGLTDKNGKEIYEGDILDNVYNKWKVFWVDNIASFRLEKQGVENTTISMYQPEIISDCEIVGNIYENPELLTS